MAEIFQMPTGDDRDVIKRAAQIRALINNENIDVHHLYQIREGLNAARNSMLEIFKIDFKFRKL